jgi:glycosyltransferase involved in cell wall biosynthesis
MRNPSSKKKVCFVSSRSGYITATGQVITDWANGRLITELFNHSNYHFSLAIFSDPVMNRNYDHALQPATLYSLPFPMSYYYGLRNVRKIYTMLQKIEHENDILIIQLPIISFLPLLFIRKPVIYHVCANVLTAANNRFKYSGISLITARSFAWFMHVIHKRLFKVKRKYVIVNGNELGTVYKKCNPTTVVSSSIYASEIIRSEEVVRREGDKLNLLFIGRPSKEKGINVLMSAFEKLQRETPEIQLHMLGVEREELIQRLAAEPVSEEALAKIVFYGFVPWSDHFKAIVQKCHVMIMCSISEGTPRVILEARALGCPVIATNVGGVSTSMTDHVDGILIQPGNEEELRRSIVKIRDEDFRQQLIAEGLKTVRNHTLVNFCNTFIQSLEAISRNEFKG